MYHFSRACIWLHLWMHLFSYVYMFQRKSIYIYSCLCYNVWLPFWRRYGKPSVTNAASSLLCTASRVMLWFATGPKSNHSPKWSQNRRLRMPPPPEFSLLKPLRYNIRIPQVAIWEWCDDDPRLRCGMWAKENEVLEPQESVQFHIVEKLPQ